MLKKLLLLLVVFHVSIAYGFESRKILWIDGSANFGKLNTAEKVNKVLDKIADTGVTDIVVGVKLVSGEVLYTSKYAPQLFEWKGDRRDSTYDYLGTIIPTAHQRGLRVYLNMNTFSEGWKGPDRGPIYSSHPEWQSLVYTPKGLMPITESEKGFAAFVNPIQPAARQYELNIIKELATKYPVEGIVLDRARYNGINSDFTDLSRKTFEKFIDAKVENWPEDIFTWQKNEDGEWETKPGKWYKQWLLWRVKVIYDFFKDARDAVKSVDSDKEFSTYVGAWYPLYYDVGVNWASKDYNVSAHYDWALPDYQNYGYAELLDFLMVGCYFYEVNIDELQPKPSERERERPEAGLEKEKKAYWYSVEGSAQISMEVTIGKIPVYGSLYVQQYKDKENPDQFVKAMKVVQKETDGIMVFDLVHLEDYHWWPEFKKGLNP